MKTIQIILLIAAVCLIEFPVHGQGKPESQQTIKEWSDANLKKLKVNNARLGPTQAGKIFFQAELENQSDAKIEAIIVSLQISDSTGKKSVISRNACIYIDLFPTAKIKTAREFDDPEMTKALTTVSYTWSYSLRLILKNRFSEGVLAPPPRSVFFNKDLFADLRPIEPWGEGAESRFIEASIGEVSEEIDPKPKWKYTVSTNGVSIAFPREPKASKELLPLPNSPTGIFISDGPAIGSSCYARITLPLEGHAKEVLKNDPLQASLSHALVTMRLLGGKLLGVKTETWGSRSCIVLQFRGVGNDTTQYCELASVTINEAQVAIMVFSATPKSIDQVLKNWVMETILLNQQKH